MKLIEDFNLNHETYSDEDNTLSSVLPFRNVLLAPRRQTLGELMVASSLP